MYLEIRLSDVTYFLPAITDSAKEITIMDETEGKRHYQQLRKLCLKAKSTLGINCFLGWWWRSSTASVPIVNTTKDCSTLHISELVITQLLSVKKCNIETDSIKNGVFLYLKVEQISLQKFWCH